MYKILGLHSNSYFPRNVHIRTNFYGIIQKIDKIQHTIYKMFLNVFSYGEPVLNISVLGTNATLLPQTYMPSFVHISKIGCDSRPRNKPSSIKCNTSRLSLCIPNVIIDNCINKHTIPDRKIGKTCEIIPLYFAPNTLNRSIINLFTGFVTILLGLS